jgi:hypothetical protein
MFTVEIYLQPFDGTLYAGALPVTCSVSAEVLRVLPVDLRLALAIYPDVSSLAFLEADFS